MFPTFSMMSFSPSSVLVPEHRRYRCWQVARQIWRTSRKDLRPRDAILILIEVRDVEIIANTDRHRGGSSLVFRWSDARSDNGSWWKKWTEECMEMRDRSTVRSKLQTDLEGSFVCISHYHTYFYSLLYQRYGSISFSQFYHQQLNITPSYGLSLFQTNRWKMHDIKYQQLFLIFVDRTTFLRTNGSSSYLITRLFWYGLGRWARVCYAGISNERYKGGYYGTSHSVIKYQLSPCWARNGANVPPPTSLRKRLH